MTDVTQINNWFDAELVSVTDMQYANALMLQMIYGSMRTGTVFGIVPTITGGTFSVTSGFAFFGETTDPTYIANTGSTTLVATVESQGALTLVNPNCYIYVMPTITTLMTNRYTKVVGTAYSSTNASDVGIKICDVVAGVAKNFTNNNIGNYFSYSANTLSISNPDASIVAVDIEGTLLVTGAVSCNTTLGVGTNANINGILDVGGEINATGNINSNAVGNFVADGEGPSIRLVRDTTTLSASKVFRIISEGASDTIPGATHVAAIQLTGGTATPSLEADYDGTQRWFSNASPGDISPTTYPNALAMLGDIALAVDALRTEILALL